MTPVTFTTQLTRFDNTDLWYYHLPIPEAAAAPFLDTDKRVICTVEGKVKFPCALMADGRGGWFININKKRRNSLGLVDGQVVTVLLEKDTSKYGMPMCEELEEILEQDEEGNALFHQLTPGKQRSLIHWIGNVKSTDIRIRRGLVTMEHLKEHGGKVDFPKLQQDIKRANRMGF